MNESRRAVVGMAAVTGRVGRRSAGVFLIKGLRGIWLVGGEGHRFQAAQVRGNSMGGDMRSLVFHQWERPPSRSRRGASRWVRSLSKFPRPEVARHSHSRADRVPRGCRPPALPSHQ